jgi:hypothetical protein
MSSRLLSCTQLNPKGYDQWGPVHLSFSFSNYDNFWRVRMVNEEEGAICGVGGSYM